MRSITFWDVKPGMTVTVVQSFYSGSVVSSSGKVVWAENEYIFIQDAGRINVHPHVGMPNVEIITGDENET